MNGNSYWWRCKQCGAEFKGKVSDVVLGHRVCGECSNQRRSFPEYCLGFYLLHLDEARVFDRSISGYRFDIFLPKYNLVIEYDGYPWHNTPSAKRNDAQKDGLCRELGISIIRIRDSRLEANEALSADIFEIKYDDRLDFLRAFPHFLRKFIGTDANELDINVYRDFHKIKSFARTVETDHSLLSHMPQLSDFLDASKANGDPAFVSTASKKIRFWLRHPEHPSLKWSMTAYELFKKQEPYTQRIKMCLKLIDKYPQLEEQASLLRNTIRGPSTFC